MHSWITSLHDADLWAGLVDALAEGWAALDEPTAWPARQLDALARYGVYSWFLPTEWGGLAWAERDLLEALVRLSSACLTTTFILTQRVAATSRLVASDNAALKTELLPPLLTSETFATVGISHLTTSRRHVAPVLTAQPHDDGYVLNGYSPWVTGADRAQTVVVGATLPGEEQLLLAVDMRTEGIDVPPPEALVALGASHTGRVEFRDALVPRERLLGEPRQNILQQGLTARTGGSQTSALALGVTDRALAILEHEALQRMDLAEPADALRAEWTQLHSDMLALADHQPVCTSEQLRQRANSLVLRASQAALAATKGAGYVSGHPAGRLCREALFFLVWSCPQPVTEAHLCELAGLG